MKPPLSAFYLLLLIFTLGFLLTFIQIGILTIAFDKLGLSPQSALLLLVTSLLGSLINLPLFTIKAGAAPPDLTPPPLRGLLQQRPREFRGKTLIAVNVGGCIIPVAFTLYLLQYHDLPMLKLITAIIIVSTVCYHFSRPIPGMGIGMPIFIAPLAAALTALIISPGHSAPLAYISGTLGVLIGADVMRLKDIRTMGVPVASFGGAGTFDGIFLTGIIAALLA